MPAGRPSKLNPEVKEAFIKTIIAGNSAADACLAAGIDYTTYQLWMRKGRQSSKGEYFSFFTDVNKAVAQSKIRLVTLISKASENDWKAAGWLLARRYPEEYAETHQVKLQVERQLEAVIDQLEKSLPQATFEQVLRVLSGESDSQEATDEAGAGEGAVE